MCTERNCLKISYTFLFLPRTRLFSVLRGILYCRAAVRTAIPDQTAFIADSMDSRDHACLVDLRTYWRTMVD
jgi:hypothetical protein